MPLHRLVNWDSHNGDNPWIYIYILASITTSFADVAGYHLTLSYPLCWSNKLRKRGQWGFGRQHISPAPHPAFHLHHMWGQPSANTPCWVPSIQTVSMMVRPNISPTSHELHPPISWKFPLARRAAPLFWPSLHSGRYFWPWPCPTCSCTNDYINWEHEHTCHLKCKILFFISIV
jgi:hypothetical protein